MGKKEFPPTYGLAISSKRPKAHQVTIGICTRNNESTISTALNSVLDLEYPKSLLRVVLIDGLSTDHTLGIAKAVLSGSNVEWSIFNDDRKGLGYARQLLVDKSESEFIAFIDADQSLNSNWLSVSLSFLASYPKIHRDKPASLFPGKMEWRWRRFHGRPTRIGCCRHDPLRSSGKPFSCWFKSLFLYVFGKTNRTFLQLDPHGV